jgi:multidrug transporter EmrE-like cation transporter
MFAHDNPTAILHYSIDVGIDFIGQGKQIIVLPLAGLLLLIGNTVLGAALKRADIRSAYILWASIPIIQIILQGAFILIWQVNQ